MSFIPSLPAMAGRYVNDKGLFLAGMTSMEFRRSKLFSA